MPASRLSVVALTVAVTAALSACASTETTASAPAAAAPAPAPAVVVETPAAVPQPPAAEVAAPPAGQAVAVAGSINPHGLPFSAGVYQCELNRKVHVRSVTPDQQSAVLNWDRKDYTMQAVGSRTGALRYEHSASGLVWLVIVGKSMLLDTRKGQQLANECKA